MDISFAVQQKIGFRFLLDALAVNSPYGEEQKKQLRRYLPGEESLLEEELGRVRSAVDAIQDKTRVFADLSRQLMGLKDIRRSIANLASGQTSDVELFEIKRYLLQLHSLAPLYRELMSDNLFSGIEITAFPQALAVLDAERTGTPTFRISDRMSAQLAAVRREKRELERQIREATDAEKQVLLIRRTAVVSREEQEEARVRGELCAALAPDVKPMLACCESLGRLDLLLAKAELAIRFGGVCPVLSKDTLAVRNMVNPMMCAHLAERGRGFTPLTLTLNRGSTVITGANMGGKSVAIKTLFLNVLCMACGLFPFAEHMSSPLFDRLILVAEDAEDAGRGLSSFGAEVMQLSDAVQAVRAGGFSLLLFDELARGTNPDEGAKIVLGTVRYLERQTVIAVFATHYDGVASAAGAQYRVMGLKHLDMDGARRVMAAGTESGIDVIERYMDYGLYPADGCAEVPRDAFHVCQLLALDAELLSDIGLLYGETR